MENQVEKERVPATTAKWIWRLVLAIIVPGLLFVLSGLIWQSQQSHDALAQARQSGVIRIGYALEAPYAFLTPEGLVTGESPEIARIIAARLGIPRAEWRLAEFGDLMEGLEARRYEVIAAGMFITPERQVRASFSLPTFQVGPGLLVRKGNPLGLHSYADLLQRARARVAVLSGSVEEARLVQLGCPDQRLIRVPDAGTGRETVRSGHADALALSAPTIRWMAMHPILGLTEMAQPFADSGSEALPVPALGGFVFRKEEAELRRAWNAELARFLGSEEHHRLVGTFGFAEAELPPSIARPANSPPR